MLSFGRNSSDNQSQGSVKSAISCQDAAKHALEKVDERMALSKDDNKMVQSAVAAIRLNIERQDSETDVNYDQVAESVKQVDEAKQGMLY